MLLKICLFLNRNISSGYSKEPSQEFFWEFKLMDKKIIIFYSQKFCFTGPMYCSTVNSEIFARALFSRNFAYVKCHEN